VELRDPVNSRTRYDAPPKGANVDEKAYTTSPKFLVVAGAVAICAAFLYTCAHPAGDFNAGASGKGRSTGIYEIDVEKQGAATVLPPVDKNEQYREPFTPTEPDPWSTYPEAEEAPDAHRK
jgi:hypothetical protein